MEDLSKLKEGDSIIDSTNSKTLILIFLLILIVIILIILIA